MQGSKADPGSYCKGLPQGCTKAPYEDALQRAGLRKWKAEMNNGRCVGGERFDTPPSGGLPRPRGALNSAIHAQKHHRSPTEGPHVPMSGFRGEL